MTLQKMTPTGPVPMSKDEQAAFLADQQILAAESDAQSLRAAALTQLAANDLVATRCMKAGVAYPEVWLAYDRALRGVIETPTDGLPQRPEYPQGT